MRSIIAFLSTLGAIYGQSIPITGPSSPSLAAFDSAMVALLAKYKIPGGSLAVTRNGSLVLAHGYGTADVAAGTAAQPDSLFRIASLSKQITSVAILKLVQEGKFGLDSKALDLIPNIMPPAGTQPDPRLKNITVRMLLQHTGGWDATQNFDVNTRQPEAAQALGVPSPASSTTMIRYMLGFPLDFNPGEHYAYSNLGYLILGRIVESFAGTTYEQYVRTQILEPLGIFRMKIGQTLPIGQSAGESKYYMPDGTPDVRTVFPFGPALVPWPYGAEYREAYDSNGGWTASAVDLVRFWNAIDGRRGPVLLTQASINQLVARPDVPEFRASTAWYGLGFLVRPVGNDFNLWHNGSLAGSRTYAVRYANAQFNTGGFNYVALFNYYLDDAFETELDNRMSAAFSNVMVWPNSDLFDSFRTPDSVHPSITAQDGVVDAASFQRGIVSGAWFTIFGSELSGTTRSWNASDFPADGSLPFNIDGVSVKVGGKPASVYFVSPTQINAQVPNGINAGGIAIELTRNGVSSGAVVAELRNASPAFFTYSTAAGLFAAAVHIDGTLVGDPTLIPGGRFAKPGEIISIYGTGFEASLSGLIITSPTPLQSLPVVRFGNVQATVQYAGLVAAGLFQVNVVVPNVPNGSQPVTVEYGSVSPSALVAVNC